MNNFNLKSYIKRLKNLTLSIIVVVVLFLILTFLFLLPAYLFSKNFPNIYSLLISALFLGFFLFLIIRRLIRIKNKYDKIHLFFIHLIFSPITLLFFLVIYALEFILFNSLKLFIKPPPDAQLIDFMFSQMDPIHGFFSNNINFVEKLVYLITLCLNLFNVIFIIIAIVFLIEVISIRIFFAVFHPVIAAGLLIGLNIFIIIGLIFSRGLFFQVKNYLKKREIK